MNVDFSEKHGSLRDFGMAIRAAVSRYWRISLAPALVVLLLVVLVGARIPSYYDSSALLVIKPQRLSFKIVDNPTKEDMQERLNALAQEILSRPRLRAVMDKFKLYPEYQGIRGREWALQKFGRNITKEYVISPTGSHSNQIFKLGFTHPDPEKALAVANELSALFIRESMTEQKSEVQGTADFLDAELTDARKRLEQTENQVQEFVSQNFGKLPEHLDAAIARLENTQNQISVNSQMISANLARRENLQREVSDLGRLGSAEGGRGEVDSEMSLSQLQSALVVLQSKYSDQHPDVINTKRRIEALQSGVGGGRGRNSVASGAGDSPAFRSSRRELTEVNAQIENLQRDNERLKGVVADLQKDIEAMPLKEQELVKIRRDYDSVKENYQRLLSARDEASIQKNLIQSQKAPQFSIVEPAELPIFPAGPSRLIILGGGVLLAALIFFLVPIAMFFINGAYKFSDDIEEATGLPVIGLIPSMVTSDLLQFQRRLTVGSFLISCVSLATGLGFIYWLI